MSAAASKKLPAGLRDPTTLLAKLRREGPEVWEKRGAAMALRLFGEMARRVPAYKDFLRKQRITPRLIRSPQDLEDVPTINKDNYLRAYPLADLSWDGKLTERQWTISTTSGSTGEPFYFPRTDLQDEQYALVAELYLRTNFSIHTKSTLYINAFPMGAWIGGLFTYEAVKRVARHGNYALSIINPGIHKEEILKALKKLGGMFDQVLIGSYGPFLKDFMDDGVREGINWKKYNLGFIFSAEGFTEGFRDHVLRQAGLDDPYRSTLNHYGTVDLGTMSYETPLSILIRRLALRNKPLYRDFFADTVKLPTLTQYIPELFHFEDVGERLICSAYSGLPLVRYDLKDHGRVTPWADAVKKVTEAEFDLQEEVRSAGIVNTVWKLPFVHVYERSDFSVSLYAFQIYPETIRRALQKRLFEKKITGKFTMLVDFDKKQNQYLEINIELQPGVQDKKELEALLTKHIVDQLLEENSEYRETHKGKGSRVHPKIVFWEYEHPKYFRPGIKQKWVTK